MRLTILVLALAVPLSVPVAACTGVVISRDGTTVVGVNEDWYRPNAYLWADRALGKAHAVVYFGYEIDDEFGPNDTPYWYEFQGINSAGLFFDSFSAPCSDRDPDVVLPPYSGSIERMIMRRCATVAEAADLMTQYDRSFTNCRQYLLVDRTGAAVVVEYGDVVWMEGETFAVTNFHLSDPSDGHYPCWRYDIATRFLEADSEASVERVARILDSAEHVSTMYSIVWSLTETEAYVYCIGNYARPLRVDLETLWAEGSGYVLLSSLPRANAN